MNRPLELEETLETLEVEIRATSEQRDRARDAYYDAAGRGDNEGMREYGSRWDKCEEDLRAFREKRKALQDALVTYKKIMIKSLIATLSEDELEEIIAEVFGEDDSN